ncbi:hypothetical protein [Paenibacillus sp. YYML68]|uniref:hypothetical protein n=1 Tax=Paenibacillus sp. YYML68 TaxID=2909250 RepID=UPI002492FE9A|nr:hypothetical protein [Paenibacillus sp. YYML68]
MFIRLIVGWLGLLLFMLPLLSACQGQGGSNVRSYSRDGALGITGVNPNVPLNTGYRYYAADMAMLEASVKEHYPNMVVDLIRTNGVDINIHLIAPTGMSEEEMRSVEAEANQYMAAQSPTYNTKVTVIGSK